MKKRMLSTILGLLLIAALGGSFLTAWQEVQAQGPWEPRAPLGTAFTYQGRLLDGGTPVEGNCDFRFSLYDVATGGTPIAGPVTASTVPVTDGYFGAEIDFGADAFDGSARYLGIEVLCPSGTGSYVAMTSRVALSPTPYALNAAGAPWAGLTGLPAGFDDDVDDVDDTVSWAEISGIVGAVANTVAAGDHDHDATYAPLGHTHDDRYYTETELSTNTAAQVHWDNLTNVPSDLSDGDDDTTYSAGTGLSLVGTTFHVVTSTIQARVSGTCPAGSSIRVI
ncbi:MAG: hypothetical protein JXD18_04935, partial [Anaerolineae bacterium]|nr:hypothetical protein [Anaerolineae bacterium]